MKKLLVTAIGAAVAFGATADIGPGEDFEAQTRGEITIAQLGSYWSEGDDATKTNQYEIVDSSGEAYTGDNALQVKTIFGKPLTFNVNSSKTGESMGSEFYFDSAVKFTVCEDAPDATYNDAKIVMWLQETEDGSATNLFVRAGYLSVGNQGVTVTPSNYVHSANIPGDFADQYHRVTIKALPDITNGQNVPGFAIWIDGDSQVAFTVNTGTRTDKKWDGSFTYSLTEAANYLDYTKYGALFPSLVQDSNDPGTTKTTITGASFDGTGWVEELKFAATAPFGDAADYVEPKGSYTIGEQDGVEFKTIEQLAAAMKNYSGAENTVTVQFVKGFEVDTPIEFNNANVTNLVIDFNGCVITNTSSAYMITNNEQKLTFVDATGKGGIRCTSAAETAGAVYQNAGGTTAINGGNFWGQLEKAGRGSKFEISGGSFQQNLDSKWLVAGKALQLNDTTGMYDVVDATYTIKFVYGEGLATTSTASVAYNVMPTAPDSATVAVTGKTFTDWDSEIVAATADAIYVAQYTVNQYTITFYDADGETVLQSGLQSHGAALSKPEDPTATGKTFAGWTPALVDPVAGAATYTATYTINTYTVAVTNGVNMTVAVSTNGVAAGGAADYTVNYGDSAKVIFTANSGYNIDGAGAYTNEFASIAANIEVEAPVATADQQTVVIPTDGKTEPYATEEAAAAAAAVINASTETKAASITLPTGASAETYYTYVQAEVASDNSVAVGFTTAGKTAAQTSADNAENVAKLDEAVVSAAANVGGGTATLSSTEPGFYYSIVSGTSPTSVTSEGARVLGTGGSLNLTVPNKGAQGFYRIKVSARAAD